MSFLIVLGVFVILAAGIAAALNCKMAQSLPLTGFALVIIGYLAGIFGVLPAAVWLVRILLVAAAGLAVYRLIIKRRADFTAVLFETLVFCAIAALFWWFCRGCAFVDWDDMSHWGKAVKFMFYENQLYTSPEYVSGFSSYPPATAILQYLLLKVCGFGFREDIVLFTNALWMASMLVFPLGYFAFAKKPLRSVLAAVLCVAVLLAFPEFYKRAGVDVLLGVQTGFLLLTAILPRTNATRWLQLCGLFALVLTKSSGAGLAVLAALAIVAEQWLQSRAEKKQGTQAARVKQVLLLASPFLAVAAGKLTWSVHTSLMGVSERWQSDGSPLQILGQMLGGTAPSYRYQVPTLFWKSITGENNYGVAFSFSFIFWFVIAAMLLAAAFIITKREDRKRIAFAAVSAFAVAGIFVLSLLYTYVILFSEGEALDLASISRYLNTCVVLLIQVSMAVFAYALYNCEASGVWVALPVVALGCTCVFNVPYIMNSIANAPIYAASSNQDRYICRYSAQRILSLGVENPRLYLITANDAGISQMRVEYELLPQKLPQQSSILATNAFLEDEWVKHCSWQEWSRELYERYDYVYILCPEDQFVREFLPVFEDESKVVVDKLFSVTKQQDGTASLRCLDD